MIRNLNTHPHDHMARLFQCLHIAAKECEPCGCSLFCTSSSCRLTGDDVYIIRTIGIALAIAGAFAQSSCGLKGRDLSYDEAEIYFARHKEDLEAIIKAEEACKPTYKQGDVAISVDEITLIACADGNYESVFRIRQMMKKAEVEMLFTGDPAGAGRVSKFLMYAQGLGVSGGGTFIVNTAQPSLPNAIYLDTNQEIRSIKTAPDHWFWGKGWS